MSLLDTWGLRIFDGLNKDIEVLMGSFVKTGSVRYEGFSKLWRDMKFPLVYCGLKSMEQTKEFVEEALRLSAAYLSDPFDIQQRTGGLYLLYAFYFSQRHVPRVKVRLSLQQFEDLKVLEKDLKAQGHLDASYILLKLKAAKAFCFVFTSKQFCFYNVDESTDKVAAEVYRHIEQAFPENLLRIVCCQQKTPILQGVDGEWPFDDIMSAVLCPKKLHETHHKYQLMKGQLGVSEKLNHVTRSMAEVISNKFQDVDDDEEEDKNDKPTKRGNRGDTIAALKAKSYSMGVEQGESASQSSSEERQGVTLSPTRTETERKRPASKRKLAKEPDTRPLIDKLMPTLQRYNLSESDDEEQGAKSPEDKKKSLETTSPRKLQKKQKKNTAKGSKVTKKSSPRKKNQPSRKRKR